MTTMIETIQQHAFSRGLDVSHVQRIAECARNVVYHSHDYIFREGERSADFLLVSSGLIALEVHSPGRGDITFLTVKGNEILGYSSLLEPFLCLYDARAVETVHAVAFNSTCLLEICEKNHEIGYEILKRVAAPLMSRLQAARIQSANLYASESV